MPNSQKSSRPYKWTNREEYSYDGVQQLGDSIKQSSLDQQVSNVSALFDRILKKNNFVLLKVDEERKELTLHTLPNKNISIKFCSMTINDIRNYFDYILRGSFQCGQGGVHVGITAKKDYNNFSWGFGYGKTLKTRVDEFFSCNSDQVNIFWSANNFKFQLQRHSRENYLNLSDKIRSNPIQRIFGASKEDSNVLKHSNITYFITKYQKPWIQLYCRSGYDYGNKSYMIAPGFKLRNNYKLNQKLALGLSLQGLNIFGKNVLKNDFASRNHKQWLERTRNFISPRMELIFRSISFNDYLPMIYIQSWGTFSRNDQNRLVTRLQFDYGIGLVSSNSRFRFDLSLFKLSTVKQGQFAFGDIRFTF